MSTIVSPYPVYEGDVVIAESACWWRFRLVRDDEGEFIVVRMNGAGDAAPTWVSWEFFDGESCVIDTGLDRPTKVRMQILNDTGWIDVLHDGPPSPSPRWCRLTELGEHSHPDDPT